VDTIRPSYVRHGGRDIYPPGHSNLHKYRSTVTMPCGLASVGINRHSLRTLCLGYLSPSLPSRPNNSRYRNEETPASAWGLMASVVKERCQSPSHSYPVIATCFSSGLCDSTFKAWSTFVSMQSGMAASYPRVTNPLNSPPGNAITLALGTSNQPVLNRIAGSNLSWQLSSS
jgi:hypothetical protein